jgi:TolA-binding protein
MKKSIFILLPLFLFLFSCQNDSVEVKEIKTLEAAADKSPTSENIASLVFKYKEYIKNNPEDEEWNGRYSYRAASRHLQNNNGGEAIRLLNDAVKQYGSSSATPNNLFLMAETYREKFKQQATADTYYQALIEGFPNHEYATKAKANIKKSKSLDDQIQDAKTALFSDTTQVRVDPRKAKTLVDLYRLYTNILPDSPNTPTYLYETYDIANSVRMYRDAAQASEKLYTKYPDFEKSSTAMFLTAFIYENNLRNLDKAEAIYKAFLAKYPNDDFANDAQVALDNLGTPADEMLKNIQEKNKANNK